VGYVDSYCERIGPGFWGEPLNSLSNLAFLFAAVLLWFLARRTHLTLVALPVLVALIFVGSAAFHTTATPWGGALDSGFIAVFLLYYIALFAHLFWNLPWRHAWLAAPAFLLCTALVTLIASLIDFTGPGMYLAALLGLAVLAASLHRRHDPAWRAFALAALVFAISLTFRTIDDPICSTFPAGTHFLWHLLNASTLYLVSRAAIIRGSRGN
jgi:hypothetical protein